MYDEVLILVMQHKNIFYSRNEHKCTNAYNVTFVYNIKTFTQNV